MSDDEYGECPAYSEMRELIGEDSNFRICPKCGNLMKMQKEVYNIGKREYIDTYHECVVCGYCR